MVSPRRAVSLVRSVSLLVLALLVGAPALAQGGGVQPVAPYFAVVSTDDAMLRIETMDVSYPVAKVAKGQLLRVDGEGSGWSRVGYPPGATALVEADALRPDAGGKTGTLSRPFKLKAFNLTTGPRGSWKPVVDAPMPAGTRLTLVDAEPVDDGRGGKFYKVVPPETARAYVQTPALRKATQDEINTAMASQGSQAPKPTPGPVAPAGAPASTGATLTEPNGTLPATDPGRAAAATPANPVVIPPSPYEKLEAAFEAVRKQPAEQAEYTELMGEIQKTMDGLDASPQSTTIKRRLGQRLEYLKLWTDIRDQKRKLAEAQGGLKENDEVIKKRLEELDRVRQYTIVGRLSASTLYDGQRLPLMYRIQTVGGSNPRTLAYLKPDPKLGIDRKLGQVVGVIGESNVDPTLRLNIITPLRVDTLEPAAPESPATPPANPAGAASADEPKAPPGG